MPVTLTVTGHKKGEVFIKFCLIKLVPVSFQNTHMSYKFWILCKWGFILVTLIKKSGLCIAFSNDKHSFFKVLVMVTPWYCCQLNWPSWYWLCWLRTWGGGREGEARLRDSLGLTWGPEEVQPGSTSTYWGSIIHTVRSQLRTNKV